MTKLSENDIKKLQEILGFPFKRKALFEQALTHSSVQGGRKNESYERLEFLGDRVLGLLIAQWLYSYFPDEKEGDLAKRFTSLVRKETLAEIVRTLKLDHFILLSKGEQIIGGRENDALLSDIAESLIAALFLEGGLDAAQTFVRKHWVQYLRSAKSPPKDAKSTLQEWAQSLGRPAPAYALVEQKGPSHRPSFSVQVSVEGFDPVEEEAGVKKNAEQKAAQKLLDHIKGTKNG